MARLIGTLLFSSLLSFPLQAFTFNNNVGAAFDKDEVKVNVASHACNNLGVTNDELLSLAEEASALFWNKVHTSRLEVVRGSLQNVSGDFKTGLACTNAPASSCNINPALVVSSDILISCNTNSTNFSGSLSVLGATIPNNISGRTINGALILVNDNSGNSFSGLSRQEKIAVLAHEIGHAVGLGHASQDKNLMYFESVATREALGWDDVDGITYLYPMEQPFGGCGTIDVHNHHNKKGGHPLLWTLLGLFLAVTIGKIFQKSALFSSTPAHRP